MARVVGNLKVWVALLAAAVGVAVAVGVMEVVLDAGPAQAATASDATIVATPLTIQPNNQIVGEASAVCPGTKRAVGGGVVQSGPPNDLEVAASGPLDSTGFTSETNDGDIAKQ